MSLKFYRDLPAFTDFSNLTERKLFHSVPDDWWVIIADIKGSTNAIKAGRYKEVNLIGAACITCVVNVLGSYDFPFVFGGDGATMVLPTTEIQKIKKELQHLQSLSATGFGLELRVGMIQLKKLYEGGTELFVGKYELSRGNFLAQFKGSALTRAEDIIKKNLPGAEVLNPIGEASPNLQGLSCRISPLKSKKGVVLTLLVRPQSQNIDKASGVLEDVLKRLHANLNQNFLSASPVDLERLNWALVPKTLGAEVRFSGVRALNYLKALIAKAVEVMVVNLSLKFNFRLGNFDPVKYKNELVINSDFKKFDETLRMVLDCSNTQTHSIKLFLEEMYQNKLIFYGTHESNESLLTCIVQSASTGKHLHFVDGAGGGYALAALSLKAQIQKSLIDS